MDYTYWRGEREARERERERERGGGEKGEKQVKEGGKKKGGERKVKIIMNALYTYLTYYIV